MAYNLERKIKDLEFDRKQVLYHLALLDANLDILKHAIALCESVTLYSTEDSVYRRKFKLFKGKIRKLILQIFRDNSTQSFTIAEMTNRLFAIEQNNNQPSEKHFDSVRKELNKFYQGGMITRTRVSPRVVQWQFKQE